MVMAHKAIIDEHILTIIQKEDIKEQSDLQTLLELRGYQVPQATLSRRLKKLQIAKINGIYKVLELGSPNLPLILNIQISDFGLIILHTNPGQAPGLAYYLDQKYVSFHPNQENGSGILGTISGDDTVLLIIKDKLSLSKVITALRLDFPYLPIKSQ